MNNKKICILDYGSGNVKSVENLIKFLGIDVKISNKPEDISDSTHLIMPGVGSYRGAMEKINKNVPLEFLSNEVLNNNKPFMGICVGMQILSEVGFEDEKCLGLGWVDGEVKKLDANRLSLPHIGWNNCEIIKNDEIFNNLEDINDFYFLHSYVFNVKNSSYILAETIYGSKFCSVLKKNNIYGIQFHPEKSQKAGMLLLKNFIQIL
tara:strand:- start:358 stop:978 length:621 start_codon:yes stop_codon:yes gene_type:complete